MEQEFIGHEADYEAMVKALLLRMLVLLNRLLPADAQSGAAPASGIGREIVDAILSRDYPVVMGMILVVAALVVVTNTLVDVLYILIDPRISTASKS